MFMKHCEFYENCELFSADQSIHMPKLFSMFRERYCLGGHDQCARYHVTRRAGKQYVPSFMLPTQMEWAEMIVKELKDEQANAGIRQPSSSLTML